MGFFFWGGWGFIDSVKYLNTLYTNEVCSNEIHSYDDQTIECTIYDRIYITNIRTKIIISLAVFIIIKILSSSICNIIIDERSS